MFKAVTSADKVEAKSNATLTGLLSLKSSLTSIPIFLYGNEDLENNKGILFLFEKLIYVFNFDFVILFHQMVSI